MKNKILRILDKLFIIVIILLLYFYSDYYKNNKNKVQERKEEPVVNLVNNDLEIQFIDVGEADCILINIENKYVLIDAGNNKDGKNLVNYFKELGITKFNYVIATHSHEDHIGGMDNIIREFDINKFLIPDVSVDNMTYTEMIKELNNKNINIKTPKVNSTFKVNNGYFKVLHIGNNKEDLNENSIVLILTYKNTSYLFMSDAEKEIELSILNKNIESDVLKVGHHGSGYSSSAQFINKVKPKYSIISVGKDNDYGFPKQITLDKLEKINSKIYRTDINGTIILKSDGNNIEISSKKTNTNKE